MIISKIIINILDFKQLRYQIPAQWSRKYLKAEYVTVSGNMEDVFYISTVDQERGISYPFSRKFNLSLTIRF